MFISLFVFASLYGIANGGAENIKVCSISVTVQQNQQNIVVVRPSVPVENCQDRDTAACFEIFKPQDNDPGMILAQNLMP